MSEISYDVRVYKTKVYKGQKVTTYGCAGASAARTSRNHSATPARLTASAAN